MNLFERDFTKLYPAEEAQWLEIKKKEIVSKSGQLEIRRDLFSEYPKAARHFMHLFPNNYLDAIELLDERGLSQKLNAFETMLNSESTGERAILNFVVKQRAYFIIGSILRTYFSFGHHEAYLFPEFQLGISYKADHLLVGKSSGGYHFVFVELEAPTGKITLANGELGDSFRKGVAQVGDWYTWLEEKYLTLSETFDKAKRDDMTLPSEFSQLDSSRIHFVVVAGRRADFSDKTRRICRDHSHQLIHYDNIVDAARELIGKPTY